MGFWHGDLEEGNKLISVLNAIEIGRIVARDIGGSDPERMAAPKVLEYVNNIFKSTDIKVNLISSIMIFLLFFKEKNFLIAIFKKINVVEGQDQFEKNYPCFAAVNRAASSKFLLLNDCEKEL